jgi:hypothetical protein
MPAHCGPFLIDLVRGEEARGTLIGRPYLPQKLIANGAESVSAFGDLWQVDVRVKVVEIVEFLVRRAVRRIHAKKINGIGRDCRGTGLRETSVQQGPGLPESFVAPIVFHVICLVILGKVNGAQEARRSKSARRDRQKLVASIRAGILERQLYERLGGVRLGRGTAAGVPP